MTRESIGDVGIGVVLVATPEETTAAAPAVGVVVGGGRTETLLALVVTGIEHLEKDRDEEEKAANVSTPSSRPKKTGLYLHSNNGNGKDNLLQLTSHAEIQLRSGIIGTLSRSQWCIDLALTGLGSVTCQHSYRNHRPHKRNIQHNRHECKEGNPA